MMSSAQLNGIAQEIADKATLAPTMEQKRNGVSVEMITQLETGYRWHNHGGNDCYACYRQKDDELS